MFYIGLFLVIVSAGTIALPTIQRSMNPVEQFVVLILFATGVCLIVSGLPDILPITAPIVESGPT